MYGRAAYLLPWRFALTRSKLFSPAAPIVAIVLALAWPTSITAQAEPPFFDNGIREAMAECSALTSNAAEFSVSSYNEPSTLSAVGYGPDLDSVRPQTSVSPSVRDDSATEGPCAWALALWPGPAAQPASRSSYPIPYLEWMRSFSAAPA